MEEYTVAQVAAILGVSRRMVLKYITIGRDGIKLNARTYRNRYVITKSDLDYFVNRCFEHSMFRRYWNMQTTEIGSKFSIFLLNTGSIF